MDSRLTSSHFTTSSIVYFFAALITLGFLSYGCSNSVTSPTIGVATGNHSPEIQSENLKGEMISLSAHKGSYVLVEFCDSQNSEARRNSTKAAFNAFDATLISFGETLKSKASFVFAKI